MSIATAECYKNHVEAAFLNAEKGVSKLPPEVFNILGMTGWLTRHFYNNLLNTEDARYLEIGTWMGSSVCSAMCGNKATVVCIDNWSEFGGPKEDFMKNFDRFKGHNNAVFIEADCFRLDISTLPKFNIYLYDGNHTMDSQYKALSHYYDCLDDVFIFIVDDWNMAEIREGTMNAIHDLGLKVHYKREIRMTWDNTHTPFDIAGKTWWNGIFVAVLEKP
jgi:hypothetical protein